MEEEIYTITIMKHKQDSAGNTTQKTMFFQETDYISIKDIIVAANPLLRQLEPLEQPSSSCNSCGSCGSRKED